MTSITTQVHHCRWGACRAVATGQVMFRIAYPDGRTSTWIKSDEYCADHIETYGPASPTAGGGRIIAHEVLPL